MKKLYLVGNLKMNMTKSELEPYFRDLKEIAEHTDNMVGVCVPFVYLCYADYLLKGSRVNYGVQNMNAKESGAYTGEVSPKMLKDYNTELVILGHSERRQYYNETDESVNEKLKTCLEYGYTAIVCFGESLSEREAGKEFDVVRTQITRALEDIDKDNVSKIIFAYEPIWAIGTGKTATSDQAQEIISFAKGIIAEKYGITNNDIVMLYGGSLKPNNATDILSKKDIDGGLIGGACLKVEDFKSIINTNVD